MPGGGGLVWYAAYGSNLSADRLRRYLEGGAVEPGARDPTPPRGWRPVQLGQPLYFCREATSWGGGGVAFVDHERVDPPPTLARAWLVTAEQFADVYAQENGLPPGSVDPLGGAPAADRWYSTVVDCGALEGEPMVTFTAPWHRAEVEVGVPSLAYLRTIAAGLREAHGLDAVAAARYLSERPGADRGWTPDALAAELAQPLP